MRPLTDIQAKKKAEVLCNKLRGILPASFIPKPFYDDRVTFIRPLDSKLIDVPPAWGIRISVDGCKYYPNDQGGCLSILDIKMSKTLMVQDIMDELFKSIVQFSRQSGRWDVEKKVKSNMDKLIHDSL